MTPDANRLYDGFSVLPDGVNGGLASSLIMPTQVAFASDFTFRDGFIKTRPPFASWPLTFADAATQANFTGIYQGGCAYNSPFGWNGFVVSVAGRLFSIQVDNNFLVSEVTPQTAVVTTADFTPPSVSAQVLIPVNIEQALSVGQSIVVDGGGYTIAQVNSGEVLATYNGGSAHAPVVSGTGILDAGQAQIYAYLTNPATYDFVYLFQAEKYVIILAGQNATLIFDGASTRRAGANELPSGVYGIYLWGRIWITLPNRINFIAGDLVYGDGTVENILRVTENSLLNGGGAFSVPQNAGLITSMTALAAIDSSLGVGNLLVTTTNMIFSVNTPVDRTTWLNLTYPIETISLLDYGPQSARATVNVNSDLWYRSVDGIRSLAIASRFMGEWGNTPMSREVGPILDADDASLLEYGSGVLFNNRLLMTCNPQRTSSGIVHQGMTSINFDLLSSMRNKLPPAWEGVWTGLNIHQVLKCQIAGQERAFAFASNAGAIELWEFQAKGAYDVFNQTSSLTRSRIPPVLETKSYDFQDVSQLKSLYTAELYLDELVDNVSLTIKYRPDQYPNWTTWATVNLCANVSQCSVPLPGMECLVFKQQSNQYAARILLPRPPNPANVISKKPMDNGYEFQFRIEGTGHFRIRRFKPHAKIVSDASEGSCPPQVECLTVDSCGTAIYGYDSHSGN